MQLAFVRTLRTPSSERFLLQHDGNDFAALDIHYLSDNRVNATLVLFEGSGVGDDQVPELLAQIDDRLLPEVSVRDNSLLFTVVVGRVLGAFSAAEEGE